MPLMTTVAERLKGINIYLVGMMGAGKSSTGVELAKALGYQFFDTDAVVETAAGQTIPEVFANQGEAAFRQIETQVLDQLSPYQRLVVATGGGIVTQQQNWSYLHQGVVVWLDVPLATLRHRLEGDMGRPLLHEGNWETTLATLLEQRQPLYAQADVRVEVGAAEAIDSVVTRTLALIADRIRPTADSPVTH